MAGNAIGLGNFLRFPVKAAQNGGGAFMIPYFVSLLLLGVPLMWAEWAMGRHSGRHGHGTLVDTFHRIWRHPAAKYLGALGVLLPLCIVIYYTYVESWTLAYALFTATGAHAGASTREGMGHFLRSYQGLERGAFQGVWAAYGFFLVTLGLNLAILHRGVSRGIEQLAKVAIPALFVLAVVLIVRVLTLGAPDPAHPEWSVWNGLGFVWNPDLSRLASAEVWLAAAGQVFFTLSLGAGLIPTYASYVRPDQDIAVNALATASTNELAEVILGGTIAIPVACAFFGVTETVRIAGEGAFNLGFQSMPLVFSKIPLGGLFGCIWFLLLFFAGIPSSVALASPAVAFLQDELGQSRGRAVMIVGAVLLVGGNLVIFNLGGGFLDEMDFWSGTFGVALLACIEAVLFSWVFDIERGWEELHRGAEMRVPRIFRHVLRYVTPLCLATLLGAWALREGVGVLLMRNVKSAAEARSRWGARGLIASLFLLIALATRRAFARRQEQPR